MQARNTLQLGTLSDRVRGGRARARSLSPERRKEIAKFARWNRKQKENGQLSDSEFVEKLVHQLRAIDPDLSSFVKKASSMPFKFQERIFQVLTGDEAETDSASAGAGPAMSAPTTQSSLAQVYGQLAGNLAMRIVEAYLAGEPGAVEAYAKWKETGEAPVLKITGFEKVSEV